VRERILRPVRDGCWRIDLDPLRRLPALGREDLIWLADRYRTTGRFGVARHEWEETDPRPSGAPEQ
jgi:hypothetical protein